MTDVWPDELDRRRLAPLRRITVEHLEESWKAGVPITLATRADATELLAERKRQKAEAPEVTVTVLIACVLARVLARHPDVNARMDGSELVTYREVSLGMAVSLDDGNLIVPVVRNADSCPPREFATRFGELRALAANRALKLPDLRGALVTLSSIGMFVDDVAGTASIPPGQTALVLVSGITEQAVVRDGGVVARPMLPVSITIDHRVVNGAAMSRFLADFVDGIEQCNVEGAMSPKVDVR